MKSRSVVKLLALLVVPVCALLLTGCWDRPFDIYLFGASSSCFPASKTSTTCQTLKIYDKVTIAVNADRQEVTYIRTGIGLDESNVVFKRLENCKVIDSENFSCTGLSSVGGKLADTTVFKDLFITSNYLSYAASRYLRKDIGRGTLEFLGKHDGWLTPLMVIGGVIIFIAFGSWRSNR